MKRSVDVAVIGGGQAGLSVSRYLTERRIDHLVLERTRVADSWRSQRWDAFCLVTPNWQCRLPDYPYRGDDPDGFMSGAEVVRYIEGFARSFAAPVLEGVEVTAVARGSSGPFELETSRGALQAARVVLAIGGYHDPIVPAFAARVPRDVVQLHSAQYRNPDALPPGAVVVVGSGQSGCQIAEDLHLRGRQVHLCLGGAPRSPRRYRGRDVVAWLEALGHYDAPIDSFDDPDAVRTKTNHYVTGRDGGREIDLRARAKEGMRLYGYLRGIEGGTLQLDPDVGARLDQADASYLRICAMIDRHIDERGIQAPPAPAYEPCWEPTSSPTALDLRAAEVGAIVWCIGFRQNFGFVRLPVFGERGQILHRRGITPVPGLYVIGLPWLHTWGSGRLCGVARDAAHLVEHLAGQRPSARAS